LKTFDELANILKSLTCTPAALNKLGVVDDVVACTQFLDEWYPDYDIRLSDRTHVIKQGYDSIHSIPKCWCGHPVKFKKRGMASGCSDAHIKQASANKAKATSIDRYGTEYAAQSHDIKSKIRESAKSVDWSLRYEKTKQTVLERLGVDNVSQAESVKRKKSSTCEANYGVPNFSQSSEFTAIMKDHNENHRDGLWLFQTAEFKAALPEVSEQTKQRRTDTFNRRYGVSNPIQIPAVRAERIQRDGALFKTSVLPPDIEAILSDKDTLQTLYDQYETLDSVSDVVGVSRATLSRRMNDHGIDMTFKFASVAENSLASYVASIYDGEILRQYRVDNKELDIFIPELNIGIEYNGLYWHGSMFKKRHYHQDKSLFFKDRGILVIHVWEDDWNDNREIIQKKLKSKIGKSRSIGARKTVVREIDRRLARPIYEQNHVQGFVGATRHLGLYYQEELVAVMSMKRHDDDVWEIVRFASSVHVSGGFSKLLKHFKKNNIWTSMYTFASLDYSHGDIYEKTGFEFSHVTVPGMWYVKKDKRYRREQFMKHKLASKLENYDPALTERQNMINHGFWQLHDSGSIKYTLTNSIQLLE